MMFMCVNPNKVFMSHWLENRISCALSAVFVNDSHLLPVSPPHIMHCHMYLDCLRFSWMQRLCNTLPDPLISVVILKKRCST